MKRIVMANRKTGNYSRIIRESRGNRKKGEVRKKRERV